MTKANKKNPVKKMTLRQQLRAQAISKLDELTRLMSTAATRVCEEADTEINPYDVMRMMTAGQNKTVRAQLVTDLANEAEARLLEIWNNQQQLDLGDKDGD